MPNAKPEYMILTVLFKILTFNIQYKNGGPRGRAVKGAVSSIQVIVLQRINIIESIIYNS